MSKLITIPNPDLEVLEANKARWSLPAHRRRSLHNFSSIVRYGISLRAHAVLTLDERFDPRIAALESIRVLTSSEWFSALVVLRGQSVLYEHYAPDFDQASPHSIQSITKTFINLMVGPLVESGSIDLEQNVRHYIPGIGSGYAKATLQQVLDMDVVNDYSEDFSKPDATYYRHEEAMGWRLPSNAHEEWTQRRFLGQIVSRDVLNRTGHAQYKDANADVIGWVLERASGRSLRSLLADIVDAAGLEGVMHISTDREGVPTIDGGACMTARDLARYMAIFARGGRGVCGEGVGSREFIERTAGAGVSMPYPYIGVRYSNHTMIYGRTIGHGGWAGQYALAHLDTGTVAVFLGVLENEHGSTADHALPIVQALESVTSMRPE